MQEYDESDKLFFQISDYLFAKDPMNTCCKENNAVDEYDCITSLILHLDDYCMTNISNIFDELFGVRPELDIIESIHYMILRQRKY